MFIAGLSSVLFAAPLATTATLPPESVPLPARALDSARRTASCVGRSARGERQADESNSAPNEHVALAQAHVMAEPENETEADGEWLEDQVQPESPEEQANAPAVEDEISESATTARLVTNLNAAVS